jgi:dTDP-4-dehydrorhamnose 3,5-epimerase
MKFIPMTIEGAYIIELDVHKDERGSFAREFCTAEFAKFGIDFQIKQCNISKNPHKGTLRGLHYQSVPYPEKKIVSCFQGSCFDVIVDLRENSPTYMKWQGVELNNTKAVYIPEYCAHGFQTLEDDTIIFYQLDEYFQSEYYKGLRWNDPKLGICWKDCEKLIISQRDESYALL